MPDGSYLLAKIEGPLPEDGWVPAKPPAKRKAKENGEAPTKRAEPGPLVWETGVTLLLEGDGASDAGDKPFVDLLNLDTGARLWGVHWPGRARTSRIDHQRRESLTHHLGHAENSLVARDAER